MNLVRAAILAAILIPLSVAGAVARPITTNEETNLRQGPGMDNPIITLIHRGTTVDVGSCHEGWCEVAWDGQHGYVIAQNLGLAHRRVLRDSRYVEEYDYGDRVYYYDERPYGYPPPHGYYYGGGPYIGFRFGGGWGGRRW